MERRLAAVLVADFAGYSSHVGRNEELAVRAARGHLDAIELVIGLHRGRVVKTMGDGLLAEFASSRDAVGCAAAIQHRMMERNAPLEASEQMLLRVGVHSGEILSESGDIFGDDVNIAARIEAHAPTGGVAVSERVRDEVAGRLDIAFRDAGSPALKNISRSIRLFDWMPLRQADAPAARPKAVADKPSLAVLPLTNWSASPQTEYIADGLTEDIISALARVPWLFVIARNSSFAYKGTPMDVRQIGRDLAVRYVLEGSMRIQGNRIRVSGQLADTASGAQVWSERFDGTDEDIFDLQDKVTAAVVAAVAPTVQMAEMERAAQSAPGNASAYDYYLQGLAALNRAQVAKAADLLDAAIDASPGYAKAMALRAWCHTLNVAWRVGYAQDTDRARGGELAKAALDLAPGDLEVAAYAGYTLAFFGLEIERGMGLVRQACDGCPSFAWAWTSLAMLEALQGDSDKVLDLADRARQLNPKDPLWFRALVAIAAVHRDAGRFDEALQAAQEGLQLNPNVVVLYVHLICALCELDRMDEARTMASRLLDLSPEFSVSRFQDHHKYFRAALHTAQNTRWLTAVGLPE